MRLIRIVVWSVWVPAMLIYLLWAKTVFWWSELSSLSRPAQIGENRFLNFVTGDRNRK